MNTVVESRIPPATAGGTWVPPLEPDVLRASREQEEKRGAMRPHGRFMIGIAAAGFCALTAMSYLTMGSTETSAFSGYGVDRAASAGNGILLAQADPGPFPGGATSVSESYQDWQVTCSSGNGAKQCRMTQQQQNRESRKRILAIELQNDGQGLSGLLVLPFGLSLADAVTLRVGEAAPAKTVPFKTCLPQGCLVPLSFDHAFVDVMAKGDILSVGTVAEGDKAYEFQISLKGFAAARDRISALVGAS